MDETSTDDEEAASSDTATGSDDTDTGAGTDTDSDTSSDSDSGTGSADRGGADGEDARLEELGDRIQSARSDAEEAVVGVEDQEEEKFAESGSEQSREEDDQAIAPPG